MFKSGTSSGHLCRVRDGTEGHIAMADLWVGDAVLSIDTSGETFFDQVYFSATQMRM